MTKKLQPFLGLLSHYNIQNRVLDVYIIWKLKIGKMNDGSAPYQKYRYLLKYLADYYKRKVKILIPNALDDQHILLSVRKRYEVDCCESLSEFINGGIVDNFNVVELKDKILWL